MKTIMVKMAAFSLVLVVASLPKAMAQSQRDNPKPKAAEYRPGQLWVMDRGIPTEETPEEGSGEGP